MMKHAKAFKIDLTAIDTYGDTGYQLAGYMVANYSNTSLVGSYTSHRLETISLIQRKMPRIAKSRPINSKTTRYIHY